MRNHRTVLILAIIAILAASTTAQDFYYEDFTTTTFRDDFNTTADWNTGLQTLRLFPFSSSIVGTLPSADSSWGVVVDGDFLYLADHLAGLQVVDITNPLLPVILGNYDSPNQVLDVKVDGNWAYLADDGNGLVIVDLSDPANPTAVGGFDPVGAVRDLFVDRDLVYLAAAGDGLYILDVSNPAAPAVLSATPLGGAAHEVWVDGDLAFVASQWDDPGGFHALDVTDPTSPVLLASLDVPGPAASCIFLSGQHAYVGARSSGLVVIDVTDPATPTIVGSFATAVDIEDIWVEGDRAYLANGDAGMKVLDVSDPTNPSTVYDQDTAGVARGVTVSGVYAFVADGVGGLRVVQARDHMTPRLLGSEQTALFPVDAVVRGDIAYVADQPGRLRILDVSDPSNMSAISSLFLPSDPLTSLEVAGAYAYLAGEGHHLRVVDVSDPTNPSVVSSMFTSSTSNDIAISGDYAYVTSTALNFDSDLIVLDISDPTNPGYLGTVPSVGTKHRIAIYGDYLLVAGGTAGLQVYDISDPTLPVLVDTAAVSGDAVDVVVQGDYAFVADYDGGPDPSTSYLTIMDLTSLPSIGSGVVLELAGRVNSVAVNGNRAFVGAHTAGTGQLHVCDITDPWATSLVESIPLGGAPLDIEISGENAFISGSQLGSDFTAYRIYQEELFSGPRWARSFPVDNSPLAAFKARLSATETGIVSWSVSADFGVSFQSIQSDYQWMELQNPGSNVVWRANLAPGAPGEHPIVDDLTLEWLYEAAAIQSVQDIPNDQGRQVRVEWARSAHDFLGDPSQIVEYAIYRQIDPGFGAGKKPRQLALDPATASESLRHHSAEKTAAGWDYLLSVPVRVEDVYATIVPTLADSTVVEGMHLSTFMVSALTATPGVFFDSTPFSGYSVDNLAPAPPQNLAVNYEASGATLDWDDATEEDFQAFRVYRGSSPDFEIGPEALLQEVGTSFFVDSTVSPWGYHYKLTSVDFAGNESLVASPKTVTDAPDSPRVDRFALHAPQPNPFNPRTTIAFSLDRRDRVAVSVYDLRGRVVARLLDEIRDPGRHEIFWNGRDAEGRAVASGRYVCRMESGGRSATRAITLLK